MSRGLRVEGNYRSCRERVSQPTSDGVARAREQLESSCGGNAEEDGDRRRDVAAGDPGVASQQAERRLERDRVSCVREEETVDAKRAASNERKLQRTRAVCVPNGGMVIMVGQGKGSERTFGLAARGVGFATAAATTTTATTGVCERAARRAGQAGRDRDDARGWAWICGLSVCRWWVGGWRRRWLLRGRVRAVVAQQLAEKEADGQGKTIDIFKRSAN